MTNPIVSREEWTAARNQLLREETELRERRAELARKRRALPWLRIETRYVFAGARGAVTLGELFAGKRQLFLQHFMFAPGWSQGCPGCSFLADHHDAALLHLTHRDVALAAVSRAPIAAIGAFQARMGWKFPWVSSQGTTFNQDFNVSSESEERPAVSVFWRSDAGEIFQTYGSDGSDDLLVGALNYLDLLPLGRQADANGHTAWLRHHDRYGEG